MDGNVVGNLVYMLLFPGFAFLIVLALAAEYFDRKLHARLQNRVGPPWFQPAADLIKLAAKEELVPTEADSRIFRVVPLIALAAVFTAFLYIPIWPKHNDAGQLYIDAPLSFYGDLVVVLYLLTIPTVTFFLGGWYSRSVYSMIGAARCIMQLFAYEVPLFLAILGPALLANTWKISELSAFYCDHPLYSLLNVIGLCVALVAMLGKLERVPFDIPEAETEIVAGTFTEYSGRLLALFRLAIDVEMVVGATLIAAVFLPWGMTLAAPIAFVLYLVKVAAVVAVLAVLRTVMARLRIDQMINFCWKVAAPIAFLQVLIDLVAKWILPA